MRSGLAAHVSSLSDPSSGSGPASFALRVSEDFPVFLITPFSSPLSQAAGGFFQCQHRPNVLAELSGEIFLPPGFGGVGL